MGEVDAVVAGGVVPTAVEVEGIGLPGGALRGGALRGGALPGGRILRGFRQRQVAVGFVDSAGAALAFEIVENIGESGFFEDVGTDDERFRVNGAGAADDQPVCPGSGYVSEVDGRELPVLPFIDGAAVDDLAMVYSLVGGLVDEIEGQWGVAAGGDEDGVLGLTGFVADVVGKDARERG